MLLICSRSRKNCIPEPMPLTERWSALLHQFFYRENARSFRQRCPVQIKNLQAVLEAGIVRKPPRTGPFRNLPPCPILREHRENSILAVQINVNLSVCPDSFWRNGVQQEQQMDKPNTTNQKLVSWINEMAALCGPEKYSGATARTPRIRRCAI